jgi:hypothetical protein
LPKRRAWAVSVGSPGGVSSRIFNVLRGILRLSVEIIGRRPASLRRRPAPFNIRYPIATQHITHLVAGIANSTQIVIL